MAQSLNSLIYAEFDKASPFDTKNTIYERVAKNIFDDFKEKGFMMNYTHNPNYIGIHPDVSGTIEDLYRSILAGDVKLDSLTMKFRLFRSSDYHDPVDVKNLLKEFLRYTTMNDKKEKILKDARLCSIVSMDGMQGIQAQDICNYVQNMSTGYVANKEGDQHVIAVRLMYAALPSVLTGLDSARLVLKALLDIYLEHVVDQNIKVMVEMEIRNLTDQLLKQSQQYKELESFTKTIDTLKSIYISKVQCVASIAIEKLNLMWNHLKKQQQQLKEENKVKKRKSVGTD